TRRVLRLHDLAPRPPEVLRHDVPRREGRLERGREHRAEGADEEERYPGTAERGTDRKTGLRQMLRVDAAREQEDRAGRHDRERDDSTEREPEIDVRPIDDQVLATPLLLDCARGV